MEFLELLLLFLSAFIIYKKPQKEKLAFGIYVFTAFLIAFLFFAIDIQYMLLPAFNL